MGAPRVIVQERDLSTTVPSFPGVSGYIVIPAIRGPADQATLVTSANDFLQRFTTNNRINVGYDNAYWSALNFLQNSRSLWVSRAANNPLFGGLVIPPRNSLSDIEPVNAGVTDPESFLLNSEQLFLLHGSDPGQWNNPLSVIIQDNTVEDQANFPFDLIVYFNQVEVERWTVSRNREARDGFGNNIYIEDRLQASAYIRAQDNTSLPLSTRPKLTDDTTVAFGNILETRAFVAEIPSVTKQQSFTVTSGNTTGENDTFSLAGVDTTIQSTDINPSQVAARIAATDYASVSQISNVQALGSVLTITSTEAAGDYVLPSLPTPETITSSGYTVVTSFVAGTTAKVVRFTVNTGNTSGQNEVFSLVGVETSVPSTATTPASVATAIAATDYTSVTTVASVTASGADVTITFTLGSGDVPNPDKTIPSTVRASVVGITRPFSAEVAAIPEQQSFRVLVGNTSGQEESVTVAGITVAIPNSSQSATAVAQNIAAATYTSVAEVTNVSASGSTVVITFTEASGNAELVTIDDGSKPTGDSFAAGSDGGPVTDGTMVQATTQQSGLQVTVLMDGDRASPAYQRELISICETRQDCVALLSTPISTENSSNYINEILNYRNVTLNANTSYASLYSPHVQILDQFNSRNIFVSPEGFVGAVISRTADNSELWFPPAGFRRGVLSRVLDVRRRFSAGEMDTLYNNGINPIRFAEGRGIVVWGQRTLLNRPSSLNRLNVRLLLIVIKPAITESLNDFIFEQNTASTRQQITSLIDDYMQSILARQGVFDYRVVCDDTNNSNNDVENNRLNVWLFVKPTQSAEFIRFTTIVTRFGLDFADAFDAV